MRVVHLVPAFSPLPETFIYDALLETTRQGVESFVLTFARQNEVNRPYPAVRVLAVPSRWHPARIREWLRAKLARAPETNPYIWTLQRQSLARVLRQIRPDVVHAHFGPMGVLASETAAALGIPTLVTFYGYDISRLARSEAWRSRYRRMWESAGATTVLSGVMGEKAIELGAPPSLVHVIHLGKRLGDYPFEARTGPVRKFVSIGRLVEKKGHTDLLQAFQRVEDTWKDANLTIIGDGPLAGDLRELVERLGLTHRVHLLGACGHADAVRHLQSADAFILCSRTGSDGDQEGTPTVLLEAQAIGLPCISTWHAGIPEVIPPENHWLLAQEGDPLSIAEKLTALLSVDGSAVRECSEYGRHHVVEHFDVVQETAKMCGLYAEVRSSFQMLKQAGMESMEGLADRPVPAVGR